MLECVVNVSEGRREAVVEAIAASADDSLLDVHTDSDHNRSVLTLAGADVERATRAVVGEAVRRIDLRHHVGVHPRLGAADVAPFVPVATGPGPQPLEEAMAARGRLAVWAADTLGLPVFLYGPERPLPEVRRHAFAALAPDFGPDVAHPTAGALCAGARSVLVAYNLWLAGGAGPEVARAVAAEMRRRRPGLVRAIGLDLGGRGQVSMNLVEPFSYGPAEAYDEVAGQAEVGRAELVGLLPAGVLAAVPATRWSELDLDPSRTIEARLEEAGRSR